MNVTTIIASAGKRPEIRRAIESVRASSLDRVQVVVVVNGPRPDPSVMEWLRQQADVRLESLPEPSLPAALHRGRQLVATPYFSFLDDDDCYLPGATDKRLAAIGQSDVLTSSGYRHGTLMKIQEDVVLSDPWAAVLRSIWLTSCSGFYRASVPVKAFEQLQPRAEWTWLAFRLCMEGFEIGVLNEPCFEICDSPTSLSKGSEYQDSFLALYKRMLEAAPPTNIRKLIEERVASDWHDRSNRALRAGDRAEALRAHWESLKAGGWRYLSHSRHLFVP